MIKAKITSVGSSVGIILPKEIMSRLHVAEGDTVTFLETTNGVEIIAYDPDFEREMDLARKVAGDYRNALKKLA